MPCGTIASKNSSGLIAIGGGRLQVEPSLPIDRRDRGLDGLQKILDRELFGIERAQRSLARERGRDRERREKKQSYKHSNAGSAIGDQGIPSGCLIPSLKWPPVGTIRLRWDAIKLAD